MANQRVTSGKRSGGKPPQGIYPKIDYETRQLKLAHFFKKLSKFCRRNRLRLRALTVRRVRPRRAAVYAGSAACKMRDDFDLGGLREHVEGRDRDDREALLQFRDVAGQSRWIARNVDHRARRGIENGAAHFGGEAGGGRIDNQRRRCEIALLQEPA